MDRDKLLSVLRKLKLPKGEYVVFGGSVLVLRSIRKGDDIDLFVSKPLYKNLRDERGWHEQWPRQGDPPLLEAIVEGIAIHAFHDWEKRDEWRPNVAKLIKTAQIREGFPFMKLEDMYDWKSHCNRLKDMRDIFLIRKYWTANK
jgi:predicted nucleotidyltransferase